MAKKIIKTDPAPGSLFIQFLAYNPAYWVPFSNSSNVTMENRLQREHQRWIFLWFLPCLMEGKSSFFQQVIQVPSLNDAVDGRNPVDRLFVPLWGVNLPRSIHSIIQQWSPPTLRGFAQLAHGHLKRGKMDRIWRKSVETCYLGASINGGSPKCIQMIGL